eukprot:PhM_4_TR13715/c2_g2_i1/m.29246
MMMGSDSKYSTRTEHYRKVHRFGYHPAATRALMLLRISADMPSHSDHGASGFQLCCIFTTEDVVSFCVDVTQVLVVDITNSAADLSSRPAPTLCLVVDDDPENEDVAPAAWSETSPPEHFIFACMCYDRALDWVRQWVVNDVMDENGISLDMRNTYSEKKTDTFSAVEPMSLVVELTLPSTIRATCINEKFLSCCAHLTFLDTSSLTNVTQIGPCFLEGCAALRSLDLSPFRNVCEIGHGFLEDCSALTSLDLSPLANVCHIDFYFLSG